MAYLGIFGWRAELSRSEREGSPLKQRIRNHSGLQEAQIPVRIPFIAEGLTPTSSTRMGRLHPIPSIIIQIGIPKQTALCPVPGWSGCVRGKRILGLPAVPYRPPTLPAMAAGTGKTFSFPSGHASCFKGRFKITRFITSYHKYGHPQAYPNSSWLRGCPDLFALGNSCHRLCHSGMGRSYEP
jgi:hypothetical protein